MSWTPSDKGARGMECFGAFEPQAAQGLNLKHDHGSQYMSHDFQEDLPFLGIQS